MAGMRPLVESGVVGDDPMEKYRERLLNFTTVLAALKSSVFRFAPFYPEEIYLCLWDLIGIASAS
jgi:hypothetical protein